MVIAPHPDDETLATGGLLQRAVGRGAKVAVLLLTRGDNNPWPQRWLEKRLWIDASARQRWGARRLAEAQKALQMQGVAHDAVSKLDWPDLAVTDRLMDATSQSVQAVAAHFAAFAPSLLVIPALGDKHPDHSAAHLLAVLALARLPQLSPHCLQYLVHGLPRCADDVVLTLSRDELQAKRAAVLAYETQISLSRGRLLALVRPQEIYQWCDAHPDENRSGMPWQVPVAIRHAFEVLVVAGDSGWCYPVPASGRVADLFDRTDIPQKPVWFKLRLRLRSPWIFDRWGWRSAGS